MSSDIKDGLNAYVSSDEEADDFEIKVEPEDLPMSEDSEDNPDDPAPVTEEPSVRRLRARADTGPPQAPSTPNWGHRPVPPPVGSVLAGGD